MLFTLKAIFCWMIEDLDFITFRSTYKNFVAEGVLANVLGLLLIIFGGIVMVVLTKQEFKRKSDDTSYSAIE